MIMFSEKCVHLFVCLCVCFEITSATGVLKYTISNWRACSLEAVFLTVRNIPIQDCLRACKMRPKCKAVNFFDLRRECELLDTDATDVPMVTTDFRRPCIFIKDVDVEEPDPVPCLNCSSEQTCNVETGVCEIRECTPLVVLNANIRGNMLNIGAKAIIVPAEGYTLDSQSSATVCQNDGTWKDVPVVKRVDCGDPPAIPSATISDGYNLYGSMRYYTCDDGYDVTTTSPTMTVTCQADGFWSSSTFECTLTDCSNPPVIPFATISVGPNLYGSTRSYTCNDGYDVTTTSPITTVTCQADGLWSSSRFECTPTVLSDTGWHSFEDSIYLFSPEILSFSEAKAYCTHLGAHLVFVETQQENNEMNQYASTHHPSIDTWWLGMTDEASEGKWLYVDTSTKAGYFAWTANEPNNMNDKEDCAVIVVLTGCWNDTNCNRFKRGVICEKSVQ